MENDKWELYDTRSDFSLTSDLATTNPAKLGELQRLFLEEAVLNHVLPIDDRVLDYDMVERSMSLFGEEVIPRIRQVLTRAVTVDRTAA